MTSLRAAALASALLVPAALAAQDRYAPERVRAERLLEEGRRRYDALDLPAAAAALRAASALDSGLLEADLLLGRTLLRWGRAEEAIAPLERSARGALAGHRAGRPPAEAVLARTLLDRARAALRPAAPAAGHRLAFRWTSDRWAGRLPSPAAVAPLRDGRLLVADARRGRLWRLDAAGRIERAADGLARPVALAVAPAGPDEGTVWVAEFEADRVTGLAADGSRRTLPGPNDPPRARPAGPAGLAVLPDGDLVVADHGGGRLLRFAPGDDAPSAGDGVLFRGVVAEGLDGPRGLAVLADGGYLVAEGRGLVRLSADGEVLERLRHADLETPVAVAVSAGGAVYVADRAGRVLEGEIEGGLAGPLRDLADDRPIAFDAPAGLALDAHGTLWVAEVGGAVSAVRTPWPSARGLAVEVHHLSAASWPEVRLWAAVRDAAGRPVENVTAANVRLIERYGPADQPIERRTVRPMREVHAGRSVWIAVPFVEGVEAHAGEIDRVLDALAAVEATAWTGLAYGGGLEVRHGRLGAPRRPAGADRDLLGAAVGGAALRAASLPAGPARPADAVETAVHALLRDARARAIVLVAPPRYDAGGLVEAGRFAAANLVAVHVVDLGRGDRAPLERLAETTGGSYRRAYAPEGLRGLAEAVGRTSNPLVEIRYRATRTNLHATGARIPLVLEIHHPLGRGTDRVSYRVP